MTRTHARFDDEGRLDSDAYDAAEVAAYDRAEELRKAALENPEPQPPTLGESLDMDSVREALARCGASLSTLTVLEVVRTLNRDRKARGYQLTYVGQEGGQG